MDYSDLDFNQIPNGGNMQGFRMVTINVKQLVKLHSDGVTFIKVLSNWLQSYAQLCFSSVQLFHHQSVSNNLYSQIASLSLPFRSHGPVHKLKINLTIFYI
jgi:hypothetical protein